MSEELIEHTIIVDEHISVQMKIPKELDALALKGLMVKANRLMNLSEVQIQTQKKSVKKSQQNGNFDWTPERLSELKQMTKTAASQQEGFRLFSAKYGISKGAVQARFYWNKR